jgi:hypothetical protein
LTFLGAVWRPCGTHVPEAGRGAPAFVAMRRGSGGFGIQGGEDGWFLRGGFFLLAWQHALEELGDDAFGFCDPGDFGARGEDAEGGIDGDLFHGFDGFWSGVALGVLLFGEVEAGDLQAVEEQAGAARVDVVGGDALEDFSDGGLDGGAVLG